MNQLSNVDYGRVEPFRAKPVLLDTAVSKNEPIELPLSGEFLYLDDDSTGSMYVRFNSADAARIPVKAGFSVSSILYRRVFLDWEPQPGKVVNLIYGTGATFTPTNDIANLGRVSAVGQIESVKIVAPIDPVVFDLSGAAGTAGWKQIVSPAENVKGVIIHTASVRARAGASGVVALAKVAPSGFADLDALVLVGTGLEVGGVLPAPVHVPVGYGVYGYFQPNYAYVYGTLEIL